MTSTKPTTRPSRHSPGDRGHAAASQNGRSAVGERLRDAREVRGVDLFRVERDTKIRAKYLGALEDGDFADLPGDVYTRGFLRNYATYLGLDADEMEEQWREEAGHVAPIRPTVIGPQPLTQRRKVVFEQSHVVIGIVAVIVLIVAGYFAFQLTRYLSYPTLAVASAGASPVVVGIGDTEYILNGNATPNTSVLISWNGQDPKVVTADDSGHWTFHAVLRSGSNQFDITAKNIDTNHASSTVRMIVFVPTPTPTPAVPQLAFVTPTDGASVPAGTVTITGTSVMVSSVNLTTAMVGPPLVPGSTMPPTPTAGTTPPPGLPTTSAATAADGTFSLAVPLQPGMWRLTLVGLTATGVQTTAVSKTISIPYKGVSVGISVSGGRSSVGIYADGVFILKAVNHNPGWTKSVTANRSVCILALSPSNVYLAINGAAPVKMATISSNLHHVMIDTKGARGVPSC
jgi:cytoskeletal protein RodZ